MIDVCLESYGAIAHVVDSLLASGVFARSGSAASAVEVDDTLMSFDMRVQRQASALPLRQAHALWLVDVCGASYEQVAIETRTTRDEVAGRVAAGRQAIRQSVLAEA